MPLKIPKNEFEARHEKNTLCGYQYSYGDLCSEEKVANEERCIFHLKKDYKVLKKSYRKLITKDNHSPLCNFQMGEYCCDELKESGERYCKFHNINKINCFDIQISEMIRAQEWDFESFYFPSNMQSKIFRQGFETKRAVSFINAEFDCDLMIPWGKFGDHVDFSNCKFNKMVRFNDCEFTHETLFNNTQFLAGVIFSDVLFNTNTFFNKTKFKGDRSEFFRLNSKKLLKYEQAEFSSNLNIFKDIDFSNSQTYIINSHFNNPTSFDYCNLQNVSFYECNLSNCNLSKSNILPAKFISCNWEQKRNRQEKKKDTKHRIILKDEDILFSKKHKDKREFIKQLGLVESCYRVFKVNRDTEKDYDNAHKFYHSEMEMKRRKAWENFKISGYKSKFTNLSRALFFELYKFLSGYGNIPGRAIWKLLLILFLFSFPLIYCNGLIPTYDEHCFVLNTNNRIINKASVIVRDSTLMTFYNLTAIYRSDINLFRVLNKADIEEMKTIKPKFNGKPINPCVLIYIAFIQYILRPIQITLIILAIRRKVQRG